MIITRGQELGHLVGRLREGGVFALDTEFERERTYWPKLQLIQVGLPDENVIIDPLSRVDLGPLFELISDRSLEKVTHAGRQDAEIFFHRTGKPPANLYDTQIAAALVGLGDQMSYVHLVQRVLKVRLKKTERVTDWGRRPLSDAQVEYALDDVRYLLEVRRRLNERLETLGRSGWLREESSFYEDPGTYAQDPQMLWTRLSGRKGLDRGELAVLRELAAWREDEAARRDEPRGRVVPDDVLVELAARSPARIADLHPLRRLHPREIERSGQAILRAVKRGLNVPESEFPEPPRAHRDDPDSALIVDLMAVLLRKRARENRVAASYFGNQRALSELGEWLSGPRTEPRPRLLTGWRGELVGEELVSLYEGKTRLGVDPEARRVTTGD
jgi:ribonuclease D